jgi:hypothetical protein
MLRASGYLGYLTPSDTSTGKINHILLQKQLPVMICPVCKNNIPICQRNIKKPFLYIGGTAFDNLAIDD